MGDLEVFEREAKDQLSYHESQDYSLYEPRFQQIVKWIKLIKAKTILDICSSWGYFIYYINQNLPLLTVHGLDSSPTKIDWCKNKGQVIISGDLRTLEPSDFAGSIYDLVVLSDNLGYFENPLEIAKKVSVWGKFVILTTPIYPDNEIEKQLSGGLWKSYTTTEDHFKIGELVGRMVELTTIIDKRNGNSWTCSLMEVK